MQHLSNIAKKPDFIKIRLFLLLLCSAHDKKFKSASNLQIMKSDVPSQAALTSSGEPKNK